MGPLEELLLTLHELLLMLRAFVLLAIPAGICCAALWYLLPAGDRRLLPPQRRRLVPWGPLELWLVLVAHLFFPALLRHLLDVILGPAEKVDVPLRTLVALSLAFPFFLATTLGIVFGLAKGRPYQLGLDSHRTGANIFLGWLVFAVASAPIFALHSGVLWACRAAGWQPDPHPLVRLIEQGRDPVLEWTVFLFQAVIVAPITEELLFRGLFQRWLASIPGFGGWRAILASALVFALLHPWPSQFSLLVLGVVLGWVTQRTQSLIPGMVLHALFNGVSCLTLALGSEQ